jgi:hypothetical protein
MSKKLIYFSIESDGSICETQDHSPLGVLDQQWQARLDKGAELAIISSPTPADSKQKKSIQKTLNRFTVKKSDGTSNRYALRLISGQTNLYVGEVDPGILMIRISSDGILHDQKKEAEANKEKLNSPYSTRMVLGRLFPGIHLMQVKVPTRMSEEEKLCIQNTMEHLVWEGVRYVCIGGTGGAKDGKFYFAEISYASAISKQYQNIAQAAIAYLGILVSECDKALVELVVRIKIVDDGDPDHHFGTNDSRAWFAEWIYRSLNLADNEVPQFRLSSKEVVFQAKGTSKVMRAEIANHPDVAADIILPLSAIKPKWKGAVGEVIEVPVVLGVREVSRIDCMYKGSYTVVQHASWDVIEREIIPKCRKEIQTLSSGFDSLEHEELLDMIGVDSKSTGIFRVAEGCLAADRHGYISRHPYIHGSIKGLIAQWAYRMLTGGSMQMPGRMLIDDGYLVIEDGKLYSGQDWMSKDDSISDQPGTRNLCVRYPVRLVEDLLPMNNLSREDAINRLVTKQRLSLSLAATVFDTQLALHGTYVLNSHQAKTVGGDYDGDIIAIIGEGSKEKPEYPMFVDFRFKLPKRPSPSKTKAGRKASSMMNICSIAFNAMGNKVGAITNAMSSSVAAGRLDLAWELGPELQKEVDSLKHDVRGDMILVTKIADQVGKPEWLDIDKKLTSVDQLKPSVKLLSESDNVARMYNVLYPELMAAVGEPLPLSEYASLFGGLLERTKTPTRPELWECRKVKSFFSSTMSQGFNWLQTKQDAVTTARVNVKNARKGKDKAQIEAAYSSLRQTEATLIVAQKTHRILTSEVRHIIGVWGDSKPVGDQMKWATALHYILSQVRQPTKEQEERQKLQTKPHKGSTGAILYHAFPQQFADAVAEQTGGEKVLVEHTVEDWTVAFNSTGDQLVRVNRDSTQEPLYHEIQKQEIGADGSTYTARLWRRTSRELPEVVGYDEDYVGYGDEEVA